MNRRLAGEVVAVLAVLALLPTVGAAQPIDEVEAGAGFHIFNHVNPMGSYLPTGPTVHAAAGRWLNDRWGIAGHFTMAIAESTHFSGNRFIRDRLTIANLLFRYRLGRPPRKWHFGAGFGWTTRFDVETYPILMFELMFTQPWTDTIDIRYGVQSLSATTLNPMMTFVWKFGQR